MDTVERNADITLFFFPMARQPLGGLKLPHFSTLHDHTQTHLTR